MLPSSSSSSSQSKFCKVCRDAGCPESEYTSHCVKINGEVVCPTLLNQACRICKIKGHTSSYCPDRKPLRYQHEDPRRDDHHGYYPREEPRRQRQEEPRRDHRIRLNLEAPALCASKHAVAVVDKVALDVRAVDIHHAEFWSDEDVDKPFMCDPREMCREFIDSLATQEKDQSQNQ